MKLLIIFSSILAAALSYPAVKTWPFTELYDTYNKLPANDPLKPHLAEGAGLIMGIVFSGKDSVFGHAILPSPTGARSWTRKQLTKAANDPNPILRLMTKRALDNMRKRNTAIVVAPAIDISTWTSSDVIKYVKDPKTKPALLPFLKKAQKEIKKSKGKKKKVTIVTPVNLVPVKSGTKAYPMGYVFQKMTFNR